MSSNSLVPGIGLRIEKNGNRIPVCWTKSRILRNVPTVSVSNPTMKLPTTVSPRAWIRSIASG